MRWLWLAAAALFAVAAVSTWFAFQNPQFVAGLGAVAAAALWKAVWPVIAKRKSPEAEAADREKWRQGIDPASTRRPGAGEH